MYVNTNLHQLKLRTITYFQKWNQINQFSPVGLDKSFSINSRVFKAIYFHIKIFSGKITL